MLAELEWDPRVRSTQIGVAVKEGVVTLTGRVDSYAKKSAAERAAQRVRGVRAVVNDIEVHLPSSVERTDADIAAEASRALTSDALVPADRIQVTGSRGVITLQGEVTWDSKSASPRGSSWAGRRAGRDQQHHGAASRGSVAGTTDSADTGGLSPQRGDQCRTDQSRGPGRQDHTPRNGELPNGKGRSGAGRLVGSWGDHSGELHRSCSLIVPGRGQP